MARMIDDILDVEAMTRQPAADHKAELRLWLRLLTCTNLIEREVRRRLRGEFGVTLPRFDVMAQLDGAADGMTLSELSQRMMVSNGNLTALVERLVAAGHVERRADPVDRRATIVRLSPVGRREFRRMAARHALWIATLMQGLETRDIGALMRHLGRLKASARIATFAKAPS